MNSPSEIKVESYIYLLRERQVMLDSDLSNLYQVEIKRLREQVKRNQERFPPDFAFKLTREEYNYLRSQSATFKSSTRGRKYLPTVFTEQGIAMLSSVLNSKTAVKVNIAIMRTFVELRKKSPNTNFESEVSEMFKIVFQKLDHLETDVKTLKQESPSLSDKRRKIGLKK